MHYAIHGHTAAEHILERADHQKQNMGLMTWQDAPDGKIKKSDVIIAKNYLSEFELSQLNRMVTSYLDFAENMAQRKIPLTMQDRETRLNGFIEMFEYGLLKDAGKVTAAIAKIHAETEFEKYRIIQDQLYMSDFDRYLVSFADLIKAVVEKFKASANFFKNAKLAISFEGRHLSDEEQQQIIAAIEENTTIEILCIVESGTEQEAIMKEQVEAFNEAVQKQCENVATVSVPEQFYRGTLRSGQVITSESSVTIIGDVNPGAKIIAQGNIVILGALKGNVHAGCTGDRSCFVFALDMQPIQIQIGDLIAKSPDEPQPKHRVRRKEKPAQEQAQIAIAKDGYIYIEPITKNILNSI